MKSRDEGRHPGPMRVMAVDAEFAGVLIAIGFALLALIGLPIGKWFVIGTVCSAA
jgi:hypothetical protein